MKLDQKNIERLRLAPGQSDQIYFDDKLRGFGLRLRAGGKKTWIIQYRVGAQQRRKTIGSFDKINAARARAAAEKDLAEVTLGADPQKRKREERARAAETVTAIVERFLEAKRREMKPRAFESLETHLRKHWRPLHPLPVHQVTRKQVAARLVEIGAERGLVAANRARSSLSSFFGWAMREGLVDVNPVIGTNKQTEEQSRDRVLSDDEVAAIWKACRDDDYGSIVRLLILTAQRREEVAGMARSEIELDARKWTMPAERTKNRQPHEVPLSDPALGIVKAAIAREGREGRELIFGEGESGRSFSGWSAAKIALDRRIGEQTKAKPAPWRLHDIRRTVATRMAELGVLPHVIEAALNHISGHKGGVAGIYNRATYWPEKRQALDLWAAHVEALVAGKAASNVVALRK
ncbi:MAG TPA: tyrosine-type recombinase/integrase [Roseiarcus sp.]|nr:tyrosine-type recombinase/integrase [Roseiarcus sp.]